MKSQFPKKVAVLGSTGSIGKSSLDVIRRLGPDRFSPCALAANSNWRLLAEQAREFKPEFAIIMDEAGLPGLAKELSGTGVKAVSGSSALISAVEADDVDIVLSAFSGASGLPASMRAVEKGKRLALANKESMVMAGELLTRKAAQTGAEIIPVDSEHSAVFQCLKCGRNSDVKRLVLTASGGPFLKVPRAEFSKITPEQALKHPVWNMGKKISIDSATLMNKALEIIEARYLFGFGHERIGVLIHPQSVVHSMVEYLDGSVIAQMSVPDMRLPIQYAFTYPERQASPVPALDLAALGELRFENPDMDRFPSLKLGFDVVRRGGRAGAVFNAANEAAVELFLAGKIGFDGIFTLVGRVLSGFDEGMAPSSDGTELGAVIAADQWARKESHRCQL